MNICDVRGGFLDQIATIPEHHKIIPKKKNQPKHAFLYFSRNPRAPAIQHTCGTHLRLRVKLTVESASNIPTYASHVPEFSCAPSRQQKLEAWNPLAFNSRISRPSPPTPTSSDSLPYKFDALSSLSFPITRKPFTHTFLHKRLSLSLSLAASVSLSVFSVQIWAPKATENEGVQNPWDDF